MPTGREPHLIAGHFASAAASLEHRFWEASALAKWVAGGESCTAFARNRSRDHVRRSILDVVDEMSARGLRRLPQAVDDEWLATKGTRCDRTARRLRSLAKTTGLRRRRSHSTWNPNRLPVSHCLAGDTAGPHNGARERAHCLPEATR